MTSSGISRPLLALIAVSAVLIISLSFAPSSEAPPVDQDLVEEYGYADYIISEGTRSSVYITHRVPSDSSASGYEWEVSSVTQGSSPNLARLSEISGNLTVVMVGGDLGNLALIQTDTVDDVTPVDVRFEMYGGSLSDLRVLTVPYSLESQLENSYTLMFGPLGNVELVLSSGSIGDLIPTEDMVSVASMDVIIGNGMTVDRMLTTGSNGRYASVNVELRGGAVGYMTNEKSVVGTLTYDFRSGSVDYFCIGADTENGSNTYLSNLNTFYVQGDVHVTVDGSVKVRQAIIGAGILDLPSRLWNGDVALASASTNVEIDAGDMPLSPDTCFMTSNRTQGNVYQFNSYTVGGTPRTKAISSDYYLSGSSARQPVYGDGGVWMSANNLTVQVGQYLYVNAQMTVSSGSIFTVAEGGRLVTTGQIYLVGAIVNNGDLVNSGIIEKREGGNISGNEPLGDGFVAYCINVSPADGRIDVMASDDDTVILRTDSTVYISRISVLLENGDREVTITAPDTLYIGGDRFLVGLREVEGSDTLGAYDLDVIGIDSGVLESMSIEVTVSCSLGSDVTCYVYHVDEETGESIQTEVVDRSYGEITFKANGTGVYYLSTVSPEGIDESEGNVLSDNAINIALAAVIVIVGAMVVYILLKKD